MGNGKDEFVGHISEQEIFRTTPYMTLESRQTGEKAEIANHLECKNNRYLFNAVGSVIRFCNIYERSMNYRLLDCGEELFEIRSIQLNSLGNLLAVIGFHEELTIYNIPDSINMMDAKPYFVKGYKIDNIGGSIKKLIWNPIIANDSTIVILNNKNQIKSWDLTISYKSPQIFVDLFNFDNFDGNAVSMTFGSDALFSGALTLYIATNDKLFSMYPFIHKNARLALTHSQVLDGFEESAAIFKSIEKEFPSDSLVTGLNSYLKVSIIRQYEFCKNLKSQLSHVLPIESRIFDSSLNKSEVYIFDQNLPNTFSPCFQGPINTKEFSKIHDIQNIYSNGEVSILSTLYDNNGNLNLSYDLQLNPLIMMWTQSGDSYENPFTVEKKPLMETPIKKKSPEYVKPKRGFGFVDLTSDTNENDSKPTLKVDTKEQETEYWKNQLSKLDTLAIDILPLSANLKIDAVIKVFDNLEDQFIIQTEGSIILADSNEWISTLMFNISCGESIDDIQINNKYRLITGNTPQLGLTLAKDILTETGLHFIQTNKSKTNNLKIFSIQEPKIDTTIAKEKSIKTYKETKEVLFKPYSVDDLLLQYQSLKFPNISSVSVTSNKKDHLKDNIEYLDDVNKISNEVLKQVSNYNTLIINLDMILKSEIKNLQQQLTILNSVTEKYYAMTDLTEMAEKVEKIGQRQEHIDSRFSKVYNKLLKALRRQISSKDLPLSTEEKIWFKEINFINKQLQSEDIDSLPNRINVLKNQIKILTNTNSEAISKFLGDKIKDLESKQHLYKLKLWLDEEGKLIDKVKDQQERNLLIVNSV
jgi:nucleoporin NUP82